MQLSGDDKRPNEKKYSLAFEKFRGEFLGEIPDYAVRQGFSIHTLLALTKKEKEKATEILVSELQKGNTDARILMGIQELKPIAAVEPLKKLLNEHPVQHLHHTIVNIALALWLIEGYKESFGLITGILKNPSIESTMFLKDWQRQEEQNNWIEAMAALRFFRCRKTIEVLKECMRSENKFIRGQAMRYALYICDVINDLITYHPMQTLAFAADNPSVRKLIIEQFDNLTNNLEPLPVEPDFKEVKQ